MKKEKNSGPKSGYDNEQSGYNDIELYILPHQQQVSQFIDQSQVFCKTDDEQAKVNVPDDEEEEVEIMVDSMVNADEKELSASYQKRSESWEIGFMGPIHTCMLTNPMQDNRKLSSQLICDEILFVIGDNLSLKVSTIISHIRSKYEYTPSYRKAWIARTKVVEKVFDNWDESYKQLPKYMFALKQYAPGTIVKLEMLSVYTLDGTCAVGNGIFHRPSGRINHAS
ncbi:hypothetical protein KIW84_044169 [Lathyrus oleraceus]|uniref:Transposase n=1 Tax=Pisum sativum TaxID=3888 RepID=A0A9D4XKD8_PEA|nr:hypothetical protein KIW84_044169 [Pisum sativum]